MNQLAAEPLVKEPIHRDQAVSEPHGGARFKLFLKNSLKRFAVRSYLYFWINLSGGSGKSNERHQEPALMPSALPQELRVFHAPINRHLSKPLPDQLSRSRSA